jgi:phosphoribosylamine-glycine ligase
MKFLFVSRFGDILPTALRIQQEGDEVTVYIDDEKHRGMYEGILETVSPLNPRYVDWADVVIFDHVGLGATADRIKKRKPVVGGGEFNDSLELDRGFAFDVMRKHGIKMPEYQQFKKAQLKDAVKYVEEYDGPLVFKPFGEAPTSATYVSSGPDDMLPMLSYLQAILPEDEFLLQEYVRGVEISTEGWFDRDHWLHPFNITFEEKKLLAENLGPNTGCAGNLIKALGDIPKTARQSLVKLTAILTRAGYVGPLDVNAIISEKGFFALEFTPRFGYDAWQTISTILTIPPGKFLYELATGGLKKMPLDTDCWAAGVRLTIPKGESKATPGVPLVGVEDNPQLFLSDVVKKGDMYFSGGADNVILAAVASHRSRAAALGEVYDTLKALKIPNKEYRTDVGKRIDTQLSDLEYWGYGVAE